MHLKASADVKISTFVEKNGGDEAVDHERDLYGYQKVKFVELNRPKKIKIFEMAKLKVSTCSTYRYKMVTFSSALLLRGQRKSKFVTI